LYLAIGEAIRKLVTKRGQGVFFGLNQRGSYHSAYKKVAVLFSK
jgi:hypothetical protein